ncbi:MAG: phosphoribosylglycinamide formyltransferase [Candidatus Puniceispirillaceae bacterium]
MPVRFAILISGRGSNMLALHDAIIAHNHDAEICLVAADKNCAGLALAQERGLPTKIIDYKGHPKEQSEGSLSQAIKSVGADFILLAGFMRILSSEFVSQFAGKIINIHPSLLPDYKGLNTHQRVLDANEAYHGVTVHIVTAGLDDGPIIAQAQIACMADDNVNSLSDRLLPVEHHLYQWVMSALINGSLFVDAQGPVWHEAPHFACDGAQLRMPLMNKQNA